MDSAFSTLGFVIFGFTFGMYAFIVESRLENGSSAIVSPPPSPSPPPPPSPLPPPPPPPPSPSPHSPPPPPYSPPQLHRTTTRSPPNHIRRHHRRPPPPPPPAHRMNGGKKVGLLFAGIAVIMQIGVVGFLVYKRRQLLKTKDLFETGS